MTRKLSKNSMGTLEAAVKGGAKEPRLAEVASHFFAIAGGPRTVAALLYEEFVASKAGSLIRQRILDMILRMTKFANEKSNVGDDMTLLSEEDIEGALKELLEELPRDEEKPADGAQ